MLLKIVAFVTTMEAMNFRDDIFSIPNDNFKDQYVLMFDLTSMQDATENCHYPEPVGEPLRLELNFTLPLEHVFELLFWENEGLWLQLTKLVLLEKHLKRTMFLSSK